MSEESRKRKSNDDHENPKRTRNEFEIIQDVQKQPGVKGFLVLLHNEADNPYCVLESAATHEKVNLCLKRASDFGSEEGPEWNLCIADEVIASGRYITESIARSSLPPIALEDLKKHCFSIIRKVRYGSSDVVPKAEVDAKEKPKTENNVLSGNSLGAKMMAKMGWSGGGLGINEQGRTETVEAYEQVNRQGLGTTNITQKISEILKNFARKRSLTSLAFSKEFDNQERAQIHSIARKHNLVSKSYGKGEDRMLTISCKFSRWELVERLIEIGGENEQYLLVYPTNFI